MTLSIALALGACGGPPEDPADCPDLDCLQAWSLDRWEKQPDLVTAALRATPDPIAQSAVAIAVSEAHPGETSDLCEALPGGPGRERCVAINRRPHLYQVDVGRKSPDPGDEGDLPSDPPQADGTSSSGKTPGRGFLSLPVALDPDDPWRDAAPVNAACPAGANSNTCQTQRAKEASLGESWEEAAGACRAIEDDKWRYECNFLTAEAALAPSRPPSMAAALRFCRSAGPYMTRCFTHMSWRSRDHAPSAGSTDPSVWAPFRELAQVARTELEAFDPELGRRFVDLLWAEVMIGAYERTAEVTGNPLAAVGDVAAPQIRSAAALTLWKLGGARGKSLDELVGMVASALERRGPTRVLRATVTRRWKAAGRFWTATAPGEDAIVWSPINEVERRALHPDSTFDIAICLLEVAARDREPDVELLVEGLHSEDWIVRWTAVRLLRAVDASNRAIRDARFDPHPLVRARARVPEAALGSTEGRAPLGP